VRSAKFPAWVRETFPHIQIENFTRHNGGGLESRYMDWHWPITFQNSTFVEFGTNPNVEVIRQPFTINSRRGIQIFPGRYEFKEHFVLATTNSAARVSGNMRYSIGDFYNGYRRGYNLGLTVRVGQRAVQRHRPAAGGVHDHAADRAGQRELQHEGVPERAAAVQHRRAAMELERAVQPDSPPAQ
jgi:hypothetical protein